jgi:hypothetical protein
MNTKRKSKSAKVREMIIKGKSVPEIVRATKASPQLVYTLRAKLRKEQILPGITALRPDDTPEPQEAQGIVGLRELAERWPYRQPGEITEVVTVRKLTFMERVANAWRRLWN